MLAITGTTVTRDEGWHATKPPIRRSTKWPSYAPSLTPPWLDGGNGVDSCLRHEDEG